MRIRACRTRIGFADNIINVTTEIKIELWKLLKKKKKTDLVGLTCLIGFTGS